MDSKAECDQLNLTYLRQITGNKKV